MSPKTKRSFSFFISLQRLSSTAAHSLLHGCQSPEVEENFPWEVLEEEEEEEKDSTEGQTLSLNTVITAVVN